MTVPSVQDVADSVAELRTRVQAMQREQHQHRETLRETIQETLQREQQAQRQYLTKAIQAAVAPALSGLQENFWLLRAAESPSTPNGHSNAAVNGTVQSPHSSADASRTAPSLPVPRQLFPEASAT